MNTPLLMQSTAASANSPYGILVGILPWLLIFVIFYMLMIRPQQKRVKEHQATIAAVKKGDEVITGGGIRGRVTKVMDDEVEVEIGQGVKVRVVKATLSHVVRPNAKPANDSMLDFPALEDLGGHACTIALGILFAIPSLIAGTPLAQSWPGWLPSAKISLGLDLAGGSQLLLEADAADAAKQRLAAMEDTVATELRRGDPKIEIGDISTSGGRLSFLVRDPTELDAAVERLRTLTQPVGLTGSRDWDVSVVDSTRIVLTPTQSASAKALKDAMTVARDVVRRRIDPQGTKEVTVINQGDRRILVQVPGVEDPEALKSLDRPDRPPRIQARRPHRRPAAGASGPGPAGQPGAAARRRHRGDGGQAPGDGLGRPADRRQAVVRPGRPAGGVDHLQFRRRAPFRPGHAGERQQAVRHHPRRKGPVGAQHQRADPRRPGADHRQFHRRKRQCARHSAWPRASCR